MGNDFGTFNNNRKCSKTKKSLSNLNYNLNNPENLLQLITEIQKNVLIKNMNNSINIGYNHLNFLIKNNANENNESLINNQSIIQNELKYIQIIDDSIDKKLLGKIHYRFQNFPSQNIINNLVEINNNNIITNNLFNITPFSIINKKTNLRIESPQKEDELNLTSFSTAAIGCKASSNSNKIKTIKIGKKDDILLYPNSDNNMLNSKSKKDTSPSIESNNTLGTISSMNNSNNQINNNITYNNERKINNKKMDEEKKINKMKYIIPQLNFPKRSQSPQETINGFSIYKDDNIDNSNLSEKNIKIKNNSDVIDNNEKDYLISCISHFAKKYPLVKKANHSPMQKINKNIFNLNPISNNINSSKNQGNNNNKNTTITNKKPINNNIKIRAKIKARVINKTENNKYLKKAAIEKNKNDSDNMRPTLKISKKNYTTYNQNNNIPCNNLITHIKHYSPRNNIIQNINDTNTINNTCFIQKKKIVNKKKINNINNINKRKINKCKKNKTFNVNLTSDNSKSEDIDDNSISKEEQIQIKNFEINQYIPQDNSIINANICSFAPNDFKTKDENQEMTKINFNSIKPKFQKENLNLNNNKYENFNKNKKYFKLKANSPKEKINNRNIIFKNLDNHFRKNFQKKENNDICKTEREFQSKELQKIVNNCRNIKNNNDEKNNYMTIYCISNQLKNNENNKKNEKEKTKKSITESESSNFNFRINEDLHESEFNDIDFLV